MFKQHLKFFFLNMGQRVKCRRMSLETVEAKDIAFKSSPSGMAKEGQQGPGAGRTPTYSMHVANTCVSKTNFVAGEDKGKDSHRDTSTQQLQPHCFQLEL